MSGTKVFFDTNVLLYLLSADTAKADRAEVVAAQGGIISVQVLNEFATVASRKIGMSWPEIIDVLAPLKTVCTVMPLTLDVYERGLSIVQRYGFAFYDALIVAAALLSGCSVLYSEDLHDGQCIDGQLTVRNPFASL